LNFPHCCCPFVLPRIDMSCQELMNSLNKKLNKRKKEIWFFIYTHMHVLYIKVFFNVFSGLRSMILSISNKRSKFSKVKGKNILAINLKWKNLLAESNEMAHMKLGVINIQQDLHFFWISIGLLLGLVLQSSMTFSKKFNYEVFGNCGSGMKWN
jgi:hypothetical protein